MNKYISILLIVAALVGGYILGGAKLGVGGTTNFSDIVGDTITVGSAGTQVSKILTGTCNLVGDGGDAVAASARFQASCAAAGVVAGDKVFVSLATSTIPGLGGLIVAGASASSTSGYIAVTLLNASTTATAVSRVGTSTQYTVIR